MAEQDLRSHNLTQPEAMDMAQNRSLWRMWHYAIRSCMPETTSTTMDGSAQNLLVVNFSFSL